MLVDSPDKPSVCDLPQEVRPPAGAERRIVFRRDADKAGSRKPGSDQEPDFFCSAGSWPGLFRAAQLTGPERDRDLRRTVSLGLGIIGRACRVPPLAAANSREMSPHPRGESV